MNSGVIQGRPARVEDYADLPGALAAGARESGLNATAGAPIIVNGSVWGAVGAASPDAPLPEEVTTEIRGRDMVTGAFLCSAITSLAGS